MKNLLFCILIYICLISPAFSQAPTPAAASEDPLACAVLTAQKVGNHDRAVLLLETTDRYIETGQKQKTEKTLELAFEETKKIKCWCQPKVAAAIAGRYFKIDQQDKTEKILSWAVESFTTPSDTSKTINYQALVPISQEYVKFGKNEKALKLLSKAFEAGKSGPNTWDQCWLLYNVSRIYLELKQYDRAFESAKAIKEYHYHKNYKFGRLSEVVNQCILTGQKEKALKMMTDLSSEAKTTIKYWGSLTAEICADRAYLYALLSDSQMASKGFNKAIENINSMKKYPYDKSEILSYVANKYIAIGQKDKAQELLAQSLSIAQTLGNKFEKLSRFVDIADKYESLEQKDKSQELLTSALKEVPGLENIQQAIILANISDLYRKTNQKDKALEILSQSLNKAKISGDTEEKLNTLGRIAIEYEKSGEKEKAQKVLNKTFKVSKTIKDMNRKLETIIDHYRTGISRGMASQIYSRQFERYIQTNYDYHAWEPVIRAIEYAKAGKHNEVVQETARIDSNDFKAWAFIGINEIYITSNQKDKALEALKKAVEAVKAINAVDNKAVLLNEIADKYAGLGKKDQVTEILSHIFNLLPKLRYNQTLLKNQLIANMADKYKIIGEENKARELLAENPEAAKIQKASPSQPFWELVPKAISYIRAKQYQPALDIIKTIKEPEFRSCMLAEIIHSYANAGQYEQAFEAGKTIRYDINLMAIIEIAEKYIESGQKEKIQEVIYQSLLACQMLHRARWKTIGLIKIADMYEESGLNPDAQTKKILAEIVKDVELWPVDEDTETDNLNVENKKVDLYLF